MAAVLSLPTQRALAEPTLRVRAQVSIDMHVTGKEPALRLEGTLTDDLGARLTNRPLHAMFSGYGAANVAQRDRNRALKTDARGAFALDAPCVSCNVVVEFAGDPYYEHANVEQVVALDRPALTLEFLEPSELAVSLDQPSTQVVVRVSSAVPVNAVPIELQNELARSIARGNSDTDGVLRLQVETSLLGPFGLGELIAKVPATSEHAAARTSKAILRTVQTQTDLQAKLDAKNRRVRVSLQLEAQSQPVVQRAVGVFVDKQHWTTLLTDERGFAAADIALDLDDRDDPGEKMLGVGTHELSASFQSDIPGLLSSESARVPLEITAPARPSIAWLLLPVLGSVAFVLWSARRKPAHTKRAETAVIASISGPEVRMGAETKGRAAAQHDISGRIEDVDSGQAIAAAVEISANQELVLVLQATAGGAFQSEALAAGDYQARVVAPGYAPIAFAFAVPHQGAFANMQISARSLRVLALETYGAFAARVLSEQRVRGKTVRETLTAAVGCGHASADVTSLARATEEIAYARPIPYESDLLELQRAAASALQRPADPEPAAGDP